MNRALDLAALKHISLDEAVTLLIAAEHGRMKGLIDLGVTTAKYTDAQGNLIPSMHSAKQAMGELDGKLKGGRDTLTSLQQHSNELNNDWQNLSHKGGPVLLTLLDAVTKALIGVYDWFDKIGKDNKLWSQISDRLVNMGTWIHDWIIQPLQEANDWYWKMANATGGGYSPGGVSPHAAPPHRASGGPVLPGSIYTVGEKGPETLVMGSQGGNIIPNGGAGGDTWIHLVQDQAIVLDGQAVGRVMDRRVARIAQRLGSV
jgi:hypothetical protein